MSKPAPPPLHIDSIAARALGWVDGPTGALVPPVHLATSFAQSPDGGMNAAGLLYARAASPALVQLEATLAALEGGAAALAFGSGMAALTATLSALPVGARLVVQQDVYWPLRHWLQDRAPRQGLQVQFVPTGDLTALAQALRQPAALVWLETPSNPALQIVDIAACAALAHAAGALLVVDSTCASPAVSRPLLLGADLVVHGAGKLLNGHGDVMAGAVIAASADTALWAELAAFRWAHGPLLGPLEGYLLLRGLKTLPVRAARACQTSLALAQRLIRHPAVRSVCYPGLPDHPAHDLACRQMPGGFGVLLTVRLRGGAESCQNALARAKIWQRATSFGATESHIEHRMAVEGGDRRSPDDLLRLAVGLEALEDLWADLDQALYGA